MDLFLIPLGNAHNRGIRRTLLAGNRIRITLIRPLQGLLRGQAGSEPSRPDSTVYQIAGPSVHARSSASTSQSRIRIALDSSLWTQCVLASQSGCMGFRSRGWSQAREICNHVLRHALHRHRAGGLQGAVIQRPSISRHDGPEYDNISRCCHTD